MKRLNLFYKKIPWENRKPIYLYLRDIIEKEGKLTTESLPDEEVRYQDSELIKIWQ